MTVREMLAEMQHEVRTSDLQPGRASELLNHLTALLGNINAEIREADMDYAKVLLALLEQDEAASRAKIRAETTPEYLRKREARDAKELCNALIASLKYLLRSLAEEMKLSR